MSKSSFQGSYERGPITLLDRVASDTATAFSKILDCRGIAVAWLELFTEGFDADTDYVGTIELYGGVTMDTARMRPLPIDEDQTVPLVSAWPTGLTLASNAITFGADFVTNGVFLIPLINVPPAFAARRVRTSGGDADALITMKMAGL